MRQPPQTGRMLGLGAGAVLAGLLVACSQSGYRAFLPATEGTGTQSLASRAAGAYYLYVGELGPPVKPFKVYPIDGFKPVRQFHRKFRVTAMALDRWGDVYTTDGNPSGGSIVAYTPGGEKEFLSFHSGALALAFDGAGNLFEADGVSIREFAARSKKQLRLITRQTRGGNALAFDRHGNLYLCRAGSVEVFAPGADKPFRSIRQGIHDTVHLLFDQSDNLFVANCPACYSSGGGGAPGSVVEYAPGSGMPLRTITEGINTAVDLAFGGSGALYVANAPFSRQGWVSVYASRGTEPIRTITKGVLSPLALAGGPNGDLYVANDVYASGQIASITVYVPDGSRPLRTITIGIHLPSAIAIGRE